MPRKLQSSTMLRHELTSDAFTIWFTVFSSDADSLKAGIMIESKGVVEWLESTVWK